MGILVVGSVGLDDVQTPAGARKRTLGGACTYFATAASLFAQVHVVAVVGSDFPAEHIAFLSGRGIDLSGLQKVEGKTFFWSGRYGDDLDNAVTIDTQLNVFAGFHPVISEELARSEYVFLANIDPDLQIEVLQQMRAPRLTALDSMNYWITSKRDALVKAMSLVDIAFLNEQEVRQFAGEPNLIRAGRAILELGPKALVIKRGEHGAMLVTRGPCLGETFFLSPAYPLECVVDPTGAGDTFAAGFMGFLAREGVLSRGALRQAVIHGNVLASFTVEDFSIDRLRTLTPAEVQERYDEFRYLTHFESLNSTEVECFRRPVE